MIQSKLMKKKIDGIEEINNNGYSIYRILKLSDDLKELIRNHLSEICNGEGSLTSASDIYTYKYTLREFINRYEQKTEEQKKGAIGELIVHLLIKCFLEEYEVNSPYFNLEEKSARKGFDIVLNKKGEKDIWITEVKSGEMNQSRNSNDAIKNIVTRAKVDLKKRLGENNSTLWRNAINSAKLAIDDQRDEKKAIIAILEEKATEAYDGKNSPNEINVVLSGVLYADMNNCFDEDTIKELYEEVNTGKEFRDTLIIAVQKETYTKVYDFIKGEVKDAVNN